MLILQVVDSLLLLVITCEELARASLMYVSALHEQVLDQIRVLGHDGHVEGILAVVVLAHVDIVDHTRVEHEQALGYLDVDVGAVQHA